MSQQPQSRALLLALLLALVAPCAAPPPLLAPPQVSLSSAALDRVADTSLFHLPLRTRASACAQRCFVLKPDDWYIATFARFAACALPLLAPFLVVWMLPYAARLAATSAPLQRSFGHPCRRAGSRALRMLMLALLPLGSYSQACTYIAASNATNSSYVGMWNCSTVGTTTLTTNCSGCLHQVLVVAGGGGGGAAGSLVYSAGGGGAGGVLTGNFTGIGNFTVIVGNGGAGGSGSSVTDGSPGNYSSITGTLLTLVASGGGKGASGTTAGGPGGSGGGVGSGYPLFGTGVAAPGIPGQGNDGSAFGWSETGYSPNYYAGSGGGGAGSAGDCGRCINPSANQTCSSSTPSGCGNSNTAPAGGNGGNGTRWAYTGLAEYAGGGGGSAYMSSSNPPYVPRGGSCLLGGGGSGGAATSTASAPGLSATKFGGGGGGAANKGGNGANGGAGYQGIVLIAVLPVRISPSLVTLLHLHSLSWRAAAASTSSFAFATSSFAFATSVATQSAATALATASIDAADVF